MVENEKKVPPDLSLGADEPAMLGRVESSKVAPSVPEYVGLEPPKAPSSTNESANDGLPSAADVAAMHDEIADVSNEVFDEAATLGEVVDELDGLLAAFAKH